jgi:hypothetical protein
MDSGYNCANGNIPHSGTPVYKYILPYGEHRPCTLGAPSRTITRTRFDHGGVRRDLPMRFLKVRSCLFVKSDSVHFCTETFSIFQEILRAKPDAGASMQFDRRPMAFPYPYGRRLRVPDAFAIRRDFLGQDPPFMWTRILNIIAQTAAIETDRCIRLGTRTRCR